MGTVARNFEKEDWFAIEDSFEADTLTAEGLDVAMAGVSLTVEENGSVMACGGVTPTGEMWLRLSRNANIQAAVEAIKIGVDDLRKSFDGVQLWCRVKTGWREGEQFVRWLGMELSGTEGEYGIWR